MSKLNVVRRCYNCGEILQIDHKDEPGYISPNALNANALVLFCDSCYNKQKYTFANEGLRCSKDYLTMMSDAAATDALIVMVVDLFSFEATFAVDLANKINNNDILIVANKRDLLPKSVNDDALADYVAHTARVAGYRVKKEDVLVTSLTGLVAWPELNAEIEKRRKRHDVYVIGAYYSGKTALLHTFLRGYENHTSSAIMTSTYPETNLSVLQIPLDSSSFIYDTPPSPSENQIQSGFSRFIANLCYPSETVRARSYSLLPGDTLALGGLAKIELREGKRTEVAYFGANTVKTLRLRGKNIAENLAKAVSKGDLAPAKETPINDKEYAVYDLTIEETGYRDIGIQGYGWIRFKGEKQTFRVYLPAGTGLYTSRSKVLPE